MFPIIPLPPLSENVGFSLAVMHSGAALAGAGLALVYILFLSETVAKYVECWGSERDAIIKARRQLKVISFGVATVLFGIYPWILLSLHLLVLATRVVIRATHIAFLPLKST